jgi:hypothetical protein
VSYRRGTEETFSAQSQAFGHNKEAYETFARMQEHLKDNKIPLDGTKYVLGKKLTIDSKTETFIDDEKANAMLTREYRAPFVVPAKA